ncbi:broad specificity phosphatase PhoE [Agrobacterium tumefaciens]|nr:broad specificity phosphatase PhoE [Agrobacterium tumefaciens]MDP9976695.1 broad specificity phosphatase PhoE [Agrobacterium tumefaciens]
MPEGLTKEEAQIEWADASEFERTHPTLVLIASALNLTELQVDTMWRQAEIA